MATPEKVRKCEEKEGSCWNQFSYKIKYGNVDSDGNEIFHRHWLPLSNTLVPDQEDKEEILKKYYEEFDCIVHVTSYSDAVKIIQSKNFASRWKALPKRSVVNHENDLFTDKLEKVNPRPCHPAAAANTFQFIPARRSDIEKGRFNVKGYGDVLFPSVALIGNEGISRYPGDFMSYFVEVIENENTTTSRVLVSTKKEKREMQSFDVFEIGSPLYRTSDNKFYYLKHLSEGLPNIVEIYKEDGFPYEDYFEHYLPFISINNSCDDTAYPGLGSEDKHKELILRLGLGLIETGSTFLQLVYDKESFLNMLKEIINRIQVDNNKVLCRSLLNILEEPDKSLKHGMHHLEHLRCYQGSEDDVIYLIEGVMKQLICLDIPLVDSFRDMMKIIKKETHDQIPEIITNRLRFCEKLKR